jgi:hypothetical protein
VDDLRKLVKRAYRQKLHTWGGDNDRSHFALVPLRWLVEVERP